MSKNKQLSWDIRKDRNGIIDIFPLGKRDEVIMSISLTEAVQAAKKQCPGIVVDQPPIKFISYPKMPKSNNTILELNGIETLAFALWVKTHLKSCEHAKEHGNQKTYFHFETSHASGIGQSTIVKCSCGVKEDITDVGSW